MPEHKPVIDEELDGIQRYYHVDSLEARVAADLRALREDKAAMEQVIVDRQLKLEALRKAAGPAVAEYRATTAREKRAGLAPPADDALWVLSLKEGDLRRLAELVEEGK